MARLKIDYGIDLGTTNSAICRMEKGEQVIIKSDTLKDTMPSCVSFNKKKSVKIGDSAYNDMKSDKRRATKKWEALDSNSYVEFKRTMGTDTLYHSSYVEKDYSSEELSAEVLKTLKSFVLDEDFSSVIVTVPAKFTANQKTATLEAAKMAGFKKCELLQEPIAAAMAYDLKSDEKTGRWMVFDFGGGTFDAALLNNEDGIITVLDTEGDNYLGGKNLDYAIVDEIIIPYLKENYQIQGYLDDSDIKKVLRDAMKTYAEEAKNQLSFKEKEDIVSNLGELGEDEDGEEIELDLTITQAEAFDVMRPYFQKAVDICKNLLKRNNMDSSSLEKLILVGGPTHCPLIRQMLKEQITPNIDTSIDPMTAVAVGAALYASTMDAEVSEEDIAVETVKLELGYESTSVSLTEYVTVKLSGNAGIDKVWVEFVRADGAWSSGKVEISGAGDIIEAQLVESKPNSFEVRCYNAQGNKLPCFPEEFTIIQGTKVSAAPLPYNIGIAIWSDVKERGVFKMAKGLEKTKPVPAIGVVNNLKTMSAIRPGVSTDAVRIPVYQVDDLTGAEGRTAALYEYIADVVITGDDVDEQIPVDAALDITLKVDTSEQMTMEVHFLASDLTVEKRLDTGKKQSIEEAEELIDKHLREAQKSIDKLRKDNVPVDAVQTELDRVKEEAKNSSEKKAVLQHLKEVLRKIEDLDEGTEWERLEKELREEYEILEKAQNEKGDSKTAPLVNQLRSQVDQVIRDKNVVLGHELVEQMHDLYFKITWLEQHIGFIMYYNRNFGTVKWKNSSRARQLLDQGMAEIANQPSIDRLRPIVLSLFDVMPDEMRNRPGGPFVH